MRKVTIPAEEVAVFEFAELEESVKDKLRESHREYLWETMDSIEDLLQERLDVLLKENGIKAVTDTKVLYSLSYCQGDGACFEGEFEYGKGWDRSTFTLQHRGNYYHFNSTVIIDEENTARGDHKPVPEKVLEEFEEKVRSIGRELERYGYEIIEEMTSDEAVDRDLDEYEYSEHGVIWGDKPPTNTNTESEGK